MKYLIILIIAVVIMAVLYRTIKSSTKSKPAALNQAFRYTRREAIMSHAEIAFYHRLMAVAGERYAIFPQVHLDALLNHTVKGQSWSSARNAIKQKSVDYVLCDKQTLAPIYAVELDDSSHDSSTRIARDAEVERIFASAKLPLVRFRGVGNLTDDQIAERFYTAAQR